MMTLAKSSPERRCDPDYVRYRDAIMDAVVAAAASAYGVTQKQVVSPARRLEVARPRMVAVFLLREFGFSLHEIGRRFHRHHSTIVNSHARMSARIGVDEMLHGVVSLIAKQAGLI
jgi:chromosomal replication initiator protein